MALVISSFPLFLDGSAFDAVADFTVEFTLHRCRPVPSSAGLRTYPAFHPSRLNLGVRAIFTRVATTVPRFCVIKPGMAAETPLPISSSNPPQFPPDQLELFRDTLKLLSDAKIPYAVSGAFALQHHTGIWRDTKDLDLFMTTDDATRALECLRGHDFEVDVPDPVWLAKAHRDDYFVDLICGMSNGALSVDRSWIERAHPAIVLDIPTRVLSAEELLASKLFVLARERFDGADIAHILYATPTRLDWQRIFTLVGDHRLLLFSTLVLFHYVYPNNAGNIPAG